VSSVGHVSSLGRRLVAHALGDERAALVQLTVLTVVLAVLTSLFGPQIVPPVTLVLPLIGGALLLAHRRMRVLLALAAVATAVHVYRFKLGDIRPVALLVLVAVGAVSYEITRGRARVGVSGPRGSAMLAELRERLRRQGSLPPLPPNWNAALVLRPAGGGGFAGDFLVSALTEDGRALEVALVDVSGKGVDAGTRALLLSGALGGLLGAVPPAQFLAASNDYLTRQDWEEGFATAVHVAVDLGTGRYTVANAGHPPTAKFDAGSGRWSLSQAEGPLLGVIPGVGFDLECGQLRPGDALLLYTDGLVEVPGRDLSVGIDRLLGEAERLVPGGFAGSVEALVDAVAPGGGDDRALFLLWRSA
jgi:hypothetical protein